MPNEKSNPELVTQIQQALSGILDVQGGWALALQIFAVVFIALLLDFIQRRVFRRLRDASRNTNNAWDDALLDAVYKPLSGLIWLIGLTVAAHLAAAYMDAEVGDWLGHLRELGIILLVTWFLLRLVRGVERNVVERKRQRGESLDPTTLDAVGKLARASIFITAGLMALQALGVNIAGLLAFGGIGGIAVGFAARDLLANFFGGLTVYMDRPFAVGDWIRSPDREIEGDVEYIGWRSTRIRTFDKRPLYVPNSVFTNIVVENPSRMFHRRIRETVGVRYADFGKLRTIIEEVRAMLAQHPGVEQTQMQMVFFDKFGASSLDFFIYCFTKTRDWKGYHEVKEDVLFRVGEIIESHGAEIAFPTRTLHVESLPSGGEESGP